MPRLSEYSEDTNPTLDDVFAQVDMSGTSKTTHVVKISTVARLIGDQLHPVGSLFFHTTSDDPNTVLGFGTWVRYGKGSVIASVADTGTFSTPNSVVGSETHTMTIGEMPAHSHSVYDPGHSHSFARDLVVTSGSGTQRTYLGGGVGQQLAWSQIGSTNGSGTGIGIYNTGGGAGFSVVQPTIPVYVWKRTA